MRLLLMEVFPVRYFRGLCAICSCLFLVSGCAAPDGRHPLGDRTPIYAEDDERRDAIDLNAALRRVDILTERWEVEPVPVGTNRQVFYMDDGLVKRSTHVVRRIAQLEKQGEVIVADQVWEEGGRAFAGLGVGFSIVQDEAGVFRAWYGGGPKSSFDALQFGYAESHDGRNWQKPARFPSPDNVVMTGIFGLVVTYNPTSPDGPVYLAAHGSRIRGGGINNVMFSRSEDGQRWTPLMGPNLQGKVRSDTLSNLFWDERIGAYRIYTRTIVSRRGRSSRQFIAGHFPSSVRPVPSRSGRLARAAEFLHVGDVPPPSGISAQFYSFNVYPFQGYYVANIASYRSSAETIDFCLAVSRNGSDWDLSWAEPQHSLVQRGGQGDPDEFFAYPSGSPPILVGDRLYVYYVGSRQDHARRQALPEGVDQYTVLMGTTRQDSLWYLENTGPLTGEVVTKSFQLEGRELWINANASWTDSEGHTAELRVELLDAQGALKSGAPLLESFPVRDDAVNRKVRWQNDRDLSPWIGQEIRLRFVLEGGVHLYAYQFGS